ncbi:MAG: hypothetical protein CVU44_15725 [Chloroflexi bacterium HGW-Chloroflexi-6]|nr:MAG: hypothetical protein CVU44_15725 [Chloroflexi bacterium HGW-Chloroflexi-6]
MSQELMLNGINADGGSYSDELGASITTEMISKVARGQKFTPADWEDLRRRRALDKQKADHFGVSEGIDDTKLEEAGWGVVFPDNLPKKSVDALKEALKPLLDHRKKQAASKVAHYYREFIGEENGYKQGESKNEFLKRFGRGPGPADPEKVPYYLMLVGSPETIPFSVQYQLDVQYAVGRIYFEKLEDYYQYAKSVVEAETKGISRGKRAAFFGVANPDDRATQMSSEHLIKPLADGMKKDYKDWKLDVVAPAKATKSTLGNYLGGKDTPALLFTASHGMNFKMSDPRQLPHTGALLCQDWPGPKVRKPITEDHYFSADDIASDADVFGMMAFIFACYGGGTPKMDNFYRQAFGEPKEIAPHAFLSQLPMKLLSHPKGGALAVFAHIERAWGSSIMWDGTVRDVETFDSTIDSLLKGKPAGNATEYFNERYAEISTDLTTELDETTPEAQDEVKLAGMWTSNNDARNYALLGDPAARMVLKDKETPAAERASLGAIVSKSPASVSGASASFQPDIVDRTPTAKAASGGPGENYGILDAFKKPAEGAEGESAPRLTGQLKEFLDKVGKYLSDALDDASSLEISTYVAEDLAGAKFENKKMTNAELRAFTRINVDGDTIVCLPKKDGEVDTEVWEIHMQMVKQAQESRTEFMKTVVSAATNLVNILPK